MRSSYQKPKGLDLGKGLSALPASCRGCGAPILWAQKADGTGAVPLDPRPVIFRVMSFTVTDQGVVEQLSVAKQDRDVDELAGRCYVNHFNTCPKANEFTRGRKP